MPAIKQKIIPNLWFDRQSEEAANFYTSIFKNSKLRNVTRATKAGFEVHRIPEGTAITVEFDVYRYRFIAINGGPQFKFNPSISFMVSCEDKEEVDAAWKKLSNGGTPLMDLGEYPFSKRYGWMQDKYGLSWQLFLPQQRSSTWNVTPTLMFVGSQYGKCEEASSFYSSVFRNSKIGNIMRYAAGMEPDREGTIQHVSFILEDQDFAAMDSARSHEFSFNEAISLMVECGTQKDIDYYWGKLTSDGGQEGVCGWLKDKYGVSWQVSPTILNKFLNDPDKDKAARVTDAFLKMKKFNINELKKTYNGTPTKVG